MKISETLTPQKFQEILISTYLRGQENEDINVKELIEEIKQKVLAKK